MKAACGAQFCEVRVDPDTGEVRVSRWTAVFDVGRVINAKTASSQLRGGIVMGIGMALADDAARPDRCPGTGSRAASLEPGAGATSARSPRGR
ncbi:molybdopterin cofactor-binding domain-containing protein [Amycolatopsis sp. NPDC051716]|uniref:molybdopterin cofactor-binding domain-containing protein n=1 Tax=Amycolatopsis sp. NPDC051716 TaxID=3155804 RepID=UPI00343187FA